VNINLTLFGQMITFILFVWFTKAFVWPPIINALKEREDKIADGLAAAERGHLELAQAKERSEVSLKEGHEAASKIILEAQKQSDTIVDTARQKAHEEGLRIIEQAKNEIENMAQEAKEVLRKRFAEMALLGAEKILEKSIDPASHQQMLDKLVQEI
jgi:F-type H+-transporting ATPase subunit b